MTLLRISIRIPVVYQSSGRRRDKTASEKKADERIGILHKREYPRPLRHLTQKCPAVCNFINGICVNCYQKEQS